MKKVLTEIWDFFKRNFGWLAILFIASLFFFYSGGCEKGTRKTVTDTTHVVIQVPQPPVVNPPFTPHQSGPTIYNPLPDNVKGQVPAATVEGLIAQVRELNLKLEALGKEYYATKKYEDSIQLEDKEGKRVGVVNLKQIVSENTLKSTQPSYQLSFPHTTTTITNTITKTNPPRNQIYIGGGIQTEGTSDLFNQVDLGLMFKNKKDVMIGVSPTYTFETNRFGVRVNLYKLISLRKK